MKYDLIKNNEWIKTKDFEVGNVPDLSHVPVKGKWLPQEILTPVFDPTTEIKTPTHEVTATHSVYSYTVSDKTVASIAIIKKQEVTNKSLSIEYGGITDVTYGDINTHLISQNKLTGAWVEGTSNPTTTFDFPLPNGQWTTLTKTQIEAIRDLVGAHVRTTWANERLHHEAIDALVIANDITAIVNYDFNVGW